jgi:hypothetical protein
MWHTLNATRMVKVVLVSFAEARIVAEARTVAVVARGGALTGLTPIEVAVTLIGVTKVFSLTIAPWQNLPHFS